MLVIVWISFLAGRDLRASRARRSRQALGAGIVGAALQLLLHARARSCPFIFGFIVAAKVGGGIVAELGAMRVNEEVDALEVMGVPSITYLVSTRMLAAMLMLPIAYLISLGAGRGRGLARLVRPLRRRLAGHLGVRLLHGHEPDRHRLLGDQGDGDLVLGDPHRPLLRLPGAGRARSRSGRRPPSRWR